MSYIENISLKIRNLVMLRLLLITIFFICAGVAVYVGTMLNDSFVYSALFCAAVGGAMLMWLAIWSYQKEQEENSPLPYASAKIIEQMESNTPKLPASSLLEATMHSMREGVLVIGSDTRIIAMNDAARTLFSNTKNGTKPEGKRLSEITRHPLINNAFRSTLESGKPTEIKIETISNEKNFFDLRVEPLKSNESSGGAIGVFFDITRLERLEKVRQEFLSNVSHELRTPLAAILAYVETLEDGAIDDPENNYRFLHVIRKNSERMQTLVEDILELTSIEAGNIHIEAEEIELAPIIEDVIESLAQRAEMNHVTIKSEISEDVVVYADPKRIEQMLTNLIDNAIKFNRENGTVTISHQSKLNRDLISIADKGTGIPPEHLPRIFERFYRVDRARSRDLGGTGLGLAIVKHLARAHGGEATVHSTYGVGSTFTIELPRPGVRV